jgi:hypothetical protein
MKIQTIRAKEVLKDFFFNFSSVSDFNALKRSISISGILNPLFVIPKKQKYQLFSGFKRFEAAVELKMDLIPVFVLSKEDKLIKKFHEVLLEHVINKSLNLVEKARIIHILEELDVSWDSIKIMFLPLLDIPSQKKVLEEIKKVLTFSSALQKYIEKYDLSLKKSRMLCAFSSKEQTMISDLGLNLQIRSVEFTEIFTLLWEISRKEQSSVEKIFKSCMLNQIFQNVDMTRNEKIFQIKTSLKKRRYPRITEWNESLTNIQKKMKLPVFMKLLWDRKLEDHGIILNAKIESADDIEQIISQLSNQDNKKAFDEMLKIV